MHAIYILPCCVLLLLCFCCRARRGAGFVGVPALPKYFGPVQAVSHHATPPYFVPKATATGAGQAATAAVYNPFDCEDTLSPLVKSVAPSKTIEVCDGG